MNLEIGDEVTIGKLVMQPYLESIGVTGDNTSGELVGFRSRKSYMSAGGWVTREGCKGKVMKQLDLDDRFTGKWYQVYTQVSIAAYMWLNFHESELITRPKPASAVQNWLKPVVK